MYYWIGEGDITFSIGGETLRYSPKDPSGSPFQIEFVFGKSIITLNRKWLGITTRTALITRNGETKEIGRFIGDGDMYEPFYRYLGSA